MMRKLSTAVFPLLLTLSGCALIPGIRDIGTLYTLDQLRADFSQFRQVIETQHPFFFADRNDVRALFDRQQVMLREGMTEIEFFRLLAPAVAALHCGHSNLRLSSEVESFLNKQAEVIPLSIVTLDGRTYVQRDPLTRGIAPGSEIISIDGLPTSELVETVLADLPADGGNITRKVNTLNRQFPYLYYLYAGGSSEFELSYIGPDGRTQYRKTVAAAPAAEWKTVMNRTLSQNSRPYAIDFYPGYALLTIKSFNFYDTGSLFAFNKFIDECFSQLKAKGYSRLILDVRDNGGGNPYCTSHLFSYLTDRPYPYFVPDTPEYRDLTAPVQPAENNFSGKLFVLANGGSFSSTSRLCALLKYLALGCFIGEETGGSFVTMGNYRDIVLWNTRLRLHYSTRAFITDLPGMKAGRGVMPDVPVKYSIQDLIAGKDLELERAVTLATAGE